MDTTLINNTEKPKIIYQSKLEQRQAEQRKFERIANRLATARLLIFTTTLVLAWFSLVEHYLSPIWSFVLFAVFLVVAKLHSRTIKQQGRAQRAEQFYTQRLEHIAGQWSSLGNTGSRYGNTDHPYSSDLDIFGEGSLFEFICDARTRMGEDKLAAWLNQGADLGTIKMRQQAIEELRNQCDFREEMFLLDAVSDNELDQAQLQRWIEQAHSIPRWWCVAATLLGMSATLSIAAWAGGYGTLPLLAVIALEIPLYAVCYRKIKQFAAKAEHVSSTLAILVQVLNLIEQQAFKTPLLQHLHEQLQSEGGAPSRQIKRLHNLIHQLDQCMLNQMYMPFALLFGIPIYISYRLEQWRERIGPQIPFWLDTVGQIEALSSLARYGFENPNNPFPEMVPELDAPYFKAVELCHPLIPAQERVHNDLCIDSERRLIMVSGSNMSGKSTLLRTVGVNLVMAFCGAPVQAKSLKTSCFSIGSAMRANDSLKQGASLFYAVISRIKTIVELAGQHPPLLFLLDEILQGTNSHDRLIGAKAIIYQLLDRDAVGLVTTHDLALTKIVDSLGNQAANIHFEDQIVNGQISFDCKIRPGVIQKSNALELMRMVGLGIKSGP